VKSVRGKRKSLTSAWSQQALKSYVRRYRQRSGCLRQRHGITQKPAREGRESTVELLSTQPPTLHGTVLASDGASATETVASLECSSGGKSVPTATSIASVDCSLAATEENRDAVVMDGDDLAGDERVREPVMMNSRTGGRKSRRKSLLGATASCTTEPAASLDCDMTSGSEPAAEENKHGNVTSMDVTWDKCTSEPTAGRRSRRRSALAAAADTSSTETIASVDSNGGSLPATVDGNNRDLTNGDIVTGDECVREPEPVMNGTVVVAADEDVTEDECVTMPAAAELVKSDIVSDSIATNADETDSLVSEQRGSEPAPAAVAGGDTTETEDECEMIDVETNEPMNHDSITDSVATALVADGNIADETDSTMTAEEHCVAATETNADVAETELINDDDGSIVTTDRSTRVSVATTSVDVTGLIGPDVSAACASNTVTTTTTTDVTTTDSSPTTGVEKAGSEQCVGEPDLSAVYVNHSTATTTTSTTTSGTNAIGTTATTTMQPDKSATHMKYSIATTTTTATQPDISALCVKRSTAATTTTTPATTTTMTTKTTTQQVDSQSTQELTSLQPVTETRDTPTLSSSFASSSSAASVKSVVSDQLVLQIPAEVRKICVDHSAGETVLHKAARLGYLVSLVSFRNYRCCTVLDHGS